MTSKFTSAVLAGTAVFALTLGATAAQAATESATAQARVLRALTLENQNRPLDFGTIVTSAAAGTVSIDVLGGRTVTGGVTASGASLAAQFDLNGTGLSNVGINADATVSLVSGGNTMTATLTESATTLQLSSAGTGTFSVGGTLNVAANQPEGNYTGNFNVVANYQ